MVELGTREQSRPQDLGIGGRQRPARLDGQPGMDDSLPGTSRRGGKGDARLPVVGVAVDQISKADRGVGSSGPEIRRAASRFLHHAGGADRNAVRRRPTNPPRTTPVGRAAHAIRSRAVRHRVLRASPRRRDVGLASPRQRRGSPGLPRSGRSPALVEESRPGGLLGVRELNSLCPRGLGRQAPAAGAGARPPVACALPWRDGWGYPGRAPGRCRCPAG